MPLDDLANNYFAIQPLLDAVQILTDANSLAVANPDCFSFIWKLDCYVDPFGHGISLPMLAAARTIARRAAASTSSPYFSMLALSPSLLAGSACTSWKPL